MKKSDMRILVLLAELGYNFTVKLKRPKVGHEGECLISGTLLNDGKKIATFEDSDLGGGYLIEPIDKEAHKAVESHLAGFQRMEFDFDAKNTFQPSMTSLVYALSCKDKILKEIKRLSKKCAVKDGGLLEWKMPRGLKQHS
jgi:hypothetical protein